MPPAGLPPVGGAFRLVGADPRVVDNPPMPSLQDRARNLGGAVQRVARRIVAGQSVLAEEGKQARRHAICRENRCGKYVDKAGGWCADCGCWMKAKVWLHSERCRLGFW